MQLTLPLLDQECDQQCTVHRAGEQLPVVHRARGCCARSRDGLALLQHTQIDECVIRFHLVQGDIDGCESLLESFENLKNSDHDLMYSILPPNVRVSVCLSTL